MTELEWLSCGDPRLLQRSLPGRISERKARLYACACCRRVEFLLRDVRALRALEVAERYAEGKATSIELLAASRWADKAKQAAWRRDAERLTYAAVGSACQAWRNVPLADPELVAAAWVGAKPTTDGTERQLALSSQWALLAELCREVVGNPFRPVMIDPMWLQWNDRAIPGLARGIYERGHFEGLPILGDALEDAGCTDRSLLDHCRGPGPHVRGCWLLDLLTGKN
jgi:hypothetical protein